MKINILELCESYGGGVRKQVDYLNEFMDRERFAPTFLVSSKRGSLNIPVQYIVDDRLSNLKAIFNYHNVLRSMHQIITKRQIKVIHAHSTIAGIWSILYKVRYHASIPIIFTPHAYYSEINRGLIKNPIIEVIEKCMNRFFFRVIHVSRDEEEFALAHRLVKEQISVVINNGVPKKEKSKGPYKIGLVNVARCDYQKNPELFIKLAQKILAELPNETFTWVGDGPLLESCRKKVVGLHLEKKIKFVGYSSDPYMYLNNSEIYFATSRYEGQPFSILEAISVGKPLLITNVIGHTELVQDNGFLLDNDETTAELVKKIKYIEINKVRLANNSYNMYKRKYDVNLMIRKITGLYSQAALI